MNGKSELLGGSGGWMVFQVERAAVAGTQRFEQCPMLGKPLLEGYSTECEL